MRKLKYSRNEEVSYTSLQLRTNKGSEHLFKWRREDNLCEEDNLLFSHGASQIDKWGTSKFETSKYYYLKPCEE